MARSSKNNETTIERCRRLWERLYPDVKKPETHLREWYAETAKNSNFILDLGCGDGGSINHVEKAADSSSVGLDVDLESLKRNTSVRFRVIGSAVALPFRNGVFDAATAQYVLEHLESPEKTFSEIARVSRPGASFLFMTTNAASYTGFAVRLIPQAVQWRIKRKILKMDESEIYPVYMRCNTRGRLERLLRGAGFEPPELIFIGGPFYFGFSYALFRIAVFLERLTDGRLRHLKFYIVGRSKKLCNYLDN